MTRRRHDEDEVAALDALIEATTAGARGDDAKFRAFHGALASILPTRCDAWVIGEPVTLVGIAYDGNKRRGLTARCLRLDGTEHIVAAADVAVSPQSKCADYLAAYRRWLGIESRSPGSAALPQRARPHKIAAADIDLSRSVELIVVSVKDRSARCQLPGSGRIVTLRGTKLWKLIPGELVLVNPHKQWGYAGHPYLSGEIVSTRLDVATLGLVPLQLKDEGAWDPEDEYWGEPGAPIEQWARPIIARGPRPMFEMEQVLPGTRPGDEADPITDSNDLKEMGEYDEALRILMGLCQIDLRCLDAHAHLGNLVFDREPAEALRHYEVGVRIGELSLGEDFDGVLHYGLIDNRPFLRCLVGYGLCLWRLKRFAEAERVFDRMLWLNPSDNQGARFLVNNVRARRAWTE